MSVRVFADSHGVLQTAPPISMRCPGCRQIGTFAGVGAAGDVQIGNRGNFHSVGHRVCPNGSCQLHIFVVRDVTGALVASYPPEIIDFDATNVPQKVVEALREAITCHAHQCYIAAAIMVRKTLEELCAERGATGDNLKKRLADLGSKVVLPPELFEGLDELRLLGNDATHVESREYDQVGREEVEIAITFTKEVLKAAYQMSDLLQRLRSLKAQNV